MSTESKRQETYILNSRIAIFRSSDHREIIPRLHVVDLALQYLLQFLSGSLHLLCEVNLYRQHTQQSCETHPLLKTTNLCEDKNRALAIWINRSNQVGNR